jgi:hypothetical protein
MSDTILPAIPEHIWIDHGRWRECVRCGQRQYRAAGQKRGAQAYTVVWLPEPQPCFQPDVSDIPRPCS